MKPWLLLAALVLPFGSVLYLAVQLRQRWMARDAAQVDALIVPPRYIFTTADEALTAKAARRRDHVESKTREARQIASGQPSIERIRLIGRK